MTNRLVFGQSDRVVLSEMTADDQPRFQKWLADNADLRCLIADPTVPTPDDQKKWFERSKQSDRKLFSIITTEGELIGNGGFIDIEPDTHQAQFRITIGNPEFLGKGFGTEATRLIIRYGFDTLGLTRIYLHVLPQNARAIKTYEKVGFVRKEEYKAPSGQMKLLMEINPVHFKP